MAEAAYFNRLLLKLRARTGSGTLAVGEYKLQYKNGWYP